MKIYIIRAIKYFLSLVILLVVIFALMYLSGTGENISFSYVLGSGKGQFMLVALACLSAIYPYFGYDKRTIECECDIDKVLRIFDMCDYTFVSQTDSVIKFRAKSVIKRIKSMGEDVIIITLTDQGLIMQGLRKDVVRLEYRLLTFLTRDEN